ncbi:MAG TPA: sugar transferase [Clostridiales bacterium]|nr:sugar transferase [Clostridiales bacterium]
MKIKLHKVGMLDVIFIFFDILCVVLATIISHLIISMVNYDEVHFASLIIHTVAVFLMLYFYDFYSKMLRNKNEIFLSITISVIISFFIMLTFDAIFMDNITRYSIIGLIINTILLILLLYIEKLIFLKIVKKVEGVSKLLVIESKYVANDLARKIKYSYLELYESWYIQIDTDDPGAVDELISSQFYKYSSIFISPIIPEHVKNKLISEAIAMNKEIYLLPNLYNISMFKTEVVQFDDTPAFRMRRFSLNRVQSFLKRVLDIIVSIIGIVITSPIMLIAVIAIKIDSPGKIIYKQERVTIHGKIFNLYKFRTMVSNAEEKTGAVLATEHDPRTTKVGRILRRFRIDELPQFVNVLSGSMSVVGPRPERPIFVEKFCKEIECYDKRFLVKAGITGFAQVFGRYDTSVKDKILYDLLYIKKYSFLLDIKLILLSIKIIFIKESSKGVSEKPSYVTFNGNEKSMEELNKGLINI